MHKSSHVTLTLTEFGGSTNTHRCHSDKESNPRIADYDCTLLYSTLSHQKKCQSISLSRTCHAQPSSHLLDILPRLLLLPLPNP